MSVMYILGWVLLVSWGATILGAVLNTDSKRSRVREAVEAVALPLTILMSKPHKERTRPTLSMQRGILAFMVIMFGRYFPTEWGPWSWAALATLVFALIVEAFFAIVPIAELMAFLTSVFGSGVAKRTKKVEVETVVETQTVPAPEPAHDGAVG